MSGTKHGLVLPQLQSTTVMKLVTAPKQIELTLSLVINSYPPCKTVGKIGPPS